MLKVCARNAMNGEVMADVMNLEALKISITKTYIDIELDRLLDLRNAVKKANTETEIKRLIAEHIQQNQIGGDYGKSTPSEKGETDKDSPTPNSK
jgi:hypothetical protein